MAKKREDLTQRIDPKLLKILEDIREQEYKRVGEPSSWRKATAILAKRIIDAGGLKEA